MNGTLYLADVKKRFRETQTQCERAIAQVPFGLWGRRLGPESNSIVTLMLHISGSMLSRWTDFLSTDGEKPGRNRDAEFEDPDTLSQQALLERWTQAWACLFDALADLSEGDLERTVTIRSQPHTVVEAINRHVAHYAHHAGQVVFLSKHLAGNQWQTISIPRHGSAAFNASMAKRPAGTPSSQGAERAAKQANRHGLKEAKNMTDVAQTLLSESRRYLRGAYLPAIEKSVAPLTDAQVWWRPNEASNSIGNLILHLSGNVRQWIVGGVGRQPIERDRQREFDEREATPKEQLLTRLRAVLDEADVVLASLTEADLTERREIQGHDTTVLKAIYHVVEHFSGHTGQILWIVKSQLGAR